jgi:predicted Zn-dependent protease with MMP-like domain
MRTRPSWQAVRVQEMTVEEFEGAVGDALDAVPAELMALLDNVVFFVEDEPPPEDPDLLGIYDGIPLTERVDAWAMGALPDRITIYRGPLTRMCEDRDELLDEIAITVVHEIAHHFGIDDERLHDLGWG